MKYNYYAIIESENEGYNVRFPDLDGALTCGDTLEEAVYMAKDVLEGYLLILENDKEHIPNASTYKELSLNIKEKEQLQLVHADTDIVRHRENNKVVNKMVTIPQYLVEIGKRENINFSQTLRNALEEQLNIK
jgi:predicted RNase H-like HicB family nuclease